MDAEKITLDDLPVEHLNDAMSRCAAFGTNMSMAKYELGIGAVPADHRHHHPYEQAIFMVSGRMTAFVGDETMELATGDLVFIPPDVPHGAIIREHCSVLEFYSPARDDMRSGTDPVMQQLSGTTS